MIKENLKNEFEENTKAEIGGEVALTVVFCSLITFCMGFCMGFGVAWLIGLF